MNKLLLYILIFFVSFTATAQTLQDPPPAVNTEQFTEPEEPVYKEKKFTPEFKDKYSDSDFNYVSKTKAKSAWDRFWESVANWFNNLFKVSDGTASTGKIIKNTLLILIMLAAAYLIVRAILNKESRWIFSRASKKISAHDITEEDIRQMDFGKTISESKNREDYRLAIRYYYLWLLKKLTEREIIKWHPDKTNTDYQYEIKNETLKNDFGYLSYVYDYSWYGDFPIDEAAFIKAEKAFLKTINTL